MYSQAGRKESHRSFNAHVRKIKIKQEHHLCRSVVAAYGALGTNMCVLFLILRGRCNLPRCGTLQPRIRTATHIHARARCTGTLDKKK